MDDGWTPTQLADSRLRILSDTPLVEQLAFAADRFGPDFDALLLTVDGEIEDMRADGTLATLSKRHLDGIDLTEAPSPSLP